MIKVAAAVICILALSCNVGFYSHISAASMQGERPKSPIDVATDKTDYYTGDIVKIEGRVPALENGTEVNVIVKDANSETFTKLRIKPTDHHTFATSFKIPHYNKLLPIGKWTINVSYALWAAKVDINVLVGEKASLRSVTISKPEIVSALVPNVEIKRGDKFMIMSEIKNEEQMDQHIFYIVLVKDNTGTTVLLDWLSKILGSNETVRVSIAWIPESGGKYTLETFVWNDLSNPTPLSPAQSAELTVSI